VSRLINTMVCPRRSLYPADFVLKPGWRILACAGCGEELVSCEHCADRAEKESGVPVSEYRCVPCVAKLATPEALEELRRQMAAAAQIALTASYRDPWVLN
jgi:hypothetical protein